MSFLEEIIEEKIAKVTETHTDAEGAEHRPDVSDVEPVLGIDLGTTNSSAAWFSPKSASPRVIPLEVDMLRNRIPSVVWFDQKNDQMVVGVRARNAALRYPQSVWAEFKRDMPSAPSTFYTLGEGEGKRKESPESLSALVLAEIKTRAERFLTEEEGRPVTIRRAVITVPAGFSEVATSATLAAARTAGFDDVQLIDEPTAAALAYSLHQGREIRKIVVFDFGGGTLDCSVLTVPGADGKPFQVKDPVGNPELGGKDFDEVIEKMLAARVIEASKRPKEEGPFDVFSDEDLGISSNKRARWKQELKERAEQIKVQLTDAEEYESEISSDDLVDFDNTPLTVPIKISRAEFEEAIADSVASAIDTLRRTLHEAKLEPGDVDRLVLVGGTTMIPAVERAIIDELGVRPYGDIDRLTAVAEGAAIYAFIKPESEDEADRVLELLASHNFGVRVRLSQLDTLIRKNDALPATMTLPYRPLHPESTEVEVALYQYDDTVVERTPDGELPAIQDDDFTSKPQRVFEVGSVRIDELTGENRAIDVTFTMDSNRVLSAVVRRQNDGVEFPLTIDRKR